MPDINASKASELHCTMYYRQWGHLTRFGFFVLLRGDPKVLEAYGDQPLTVIPGLPPVPPPYNTFVLKQFALIDISDELLLVFE